MLDKEAKNIDAVIVAIPDHMHATAAMWCMERGKHVYVQKPLARTIWEARQLREAAAKYKVATQMGNQGYSNEGTRQCAEMIWTGEIGNVTEVHAWTDRPLWPQGLTEIPPKNPSLVLSTGISGSASPRSARSPRAADTEPDRWDGFFYQPFNWRGFYDFGCGALGDMACHILGAPNMALHLSKRKIVGVECIKKEGISPFMFPKASVIRFDFAPYGDMPALKVFWYDGLKETPRSPVFPKANGSAIRRRSALPAGSAGQTWPRRPPRRWPRRHSHAVASISARPAASSTAKDFEALKAPDAELRVPHSQRQRLHRRQGHADHRHLRRSHASPSGRKDEGLPDARRRC